MKIRMGFVSNSSSSSFICLGVRIPMSAIEEGIAADSEDKFYEIMDDYRDLVYQDSENNDNYVYYGPYSLHSSDDYGIGVTNVLKDLSKGESLEHLEERLKTEAKELFQIKSDEDLEFGLFNGIVAS